MFESVLKNQKMTLKEDKTVQEVEKITVLGYEIEAGESLQRKVDYNDCWKYRSLKH